MITRSALGYGCSFIEGQILILYIANPATGCLRATTSGGGARIRVVATPKDKE